MLMSKSELSSEYITQEIANCFWLLRQVVIVALSLARLKAGSSIAARIAMMAMTTSSSIRVNPAQLAGECPAARCSCLLATPQSIRPNSCDRNRKKSLGRWFLLIQTQVSVLTIDTRRRSGVPGLGFIIKAFQQSRTVLQWTRNRIFRSPFRVQLQHTFPVLAICVKKIRTTSCGQVPQVPGH